MPLSSTKTIKKRLRSVKNISQITKAMEAVSATKMRRSQQFALHARPYALASLEMLKNLLSRLPSRSDVPLLTIRPVQNSVLLIIASDKGLAGAHNSNVFRKTEEWIKNKRAVGATFAVIAVGKKAKEFCLRRNINTTDSFNNFGDYTTLKETLPVAELLLKGFLNNLWDEVEAVYTNFRTTLKQEVSLKKILPTTIEGIEEVVSAILPERGRFAPETGRTESVRLPRYNFEYKFEPSPSEVLGKLVPQLLKMHIHHIILESNASEHSARMIAMKNASDNAKELMGDLSLAYNKARQASITRELTEITAGKEALEG